MNRRGFLKALGVGITALATGLGLVPKAEGVTSIWKVPIDDWPKHAVNPAAGLGANATAREIEVHFVPWERRRVHGVDCWLHPRAAKAFDEHNVRVALYGTSSWRIESGDIVLAEDGSPGPHTGGTAWVTRRIDYGQGPSAPTRAPLSGGRVGR